jgi:beta-phosphoglucomutase family hydrolase
MNKHNFQAVIFDLDGVITKTALVHSSAWREMFNNYLKYREKKYGEPFREFTHNNDYLPYVDGKPRYKGVESFLESRGISIPYGDPADDPDKETICGLGNKKNSFFNKVLKRDGVEVYDSTISLIRRLKNERIKTGVASSSKNCRAVLERAGLLNLFDTRVDGEVSAQIGLKGKPEPDIFIKACYNLESLPGLTVIVEDAVSGVQAGRNGGFGLVMGIAREDNSDELKKNGADIVVEDLSELTGIEEIDDWFRK